MENAERYHCMLTCITNFMRHLNCKQEESVSDYKLHLLIELSYYSTLPMFKDVLPGIVKTIPPDSPMQGMLSRGILYAHMIKTGAGYPNRVEDIDPSWMDVYS